VTANSSLDQERAVGRFLEEPASDETLAEIFDHRRGQITGNLRLRRTTAGKKMDHKWAEWDERLNVPDAVRGSWICWILPTVTQIA
jgi:hypothetical protein